MSEVPLYTTTERGGNRFTGSVDFYLKKGAPRPEYGLDCLIVFKFAR